MELIHEFKQNINGLAIVDDILFAVSTSNHSIYQISFVERKISLTKGPEIPQVCGIAANKSGIMYVGCRGKIIEMTKEGKVTELVGAGEYGHKDGIGKNAQMKYPFGICFDENNIAYFCDSDNNCIRKVSPKGEVTTICGDTTFGYKDGKGKEAKLNSPTGIAYNVSKKIFYITDSNNKKIRTMTPNGTISTFCEYSVRLRSIAIDGGGNLFVTAGDAKKTPMGILRISPKGEITNLKNTDVSGIDHSRGLAFNSKGDLFVTTGMFGKVYVLRNCTQFPPQPIVTSITSTSSTKQEIPNIPPTQLISTPVQSPSISTSNTDITSMID